VAGKTSRMIHEAKGACLFLAPQLLCSDNIVEKLQPPEGQLPYGKLEDEEMDLGQIPVCKQRFRQSLFHLPFLCYEFTPI
jgi:hypothetical protein